MKINGTDISTCGAKQHRMVLGHCDHNMISELIPGAVLPVYGAASLSLKTLTVTVNIMGTTRADVIGKRSSLLALMTGQLDITLDNYTNKFHGVLTGHREEEKVQKRWHQMELSFEGYEYGTDVTAETTDAYTSALAITNPGNMPSPCRVEITPRLGVASITLTGICRDSFTGEDLPVTIENLTTGKKVVLDAKTGLITEDGSIKDADIWALPSLLPGVNSITCDNVSMTIKVIVTPFYD